MIKCSIVFLNILGVKYEII